MRIKLVLFSLSLFVLNSWAADQTVLRGTLLDAGCSAVSGGAPPDLPRGTNSPTATGAGSAGAYGSMGTSGAGSHAGMAGTNAASATVRKTEKSLDIPKTTSATATGPGTSGQYASNGMAGSGEPLNMSPSAAGSKYGSCQVGTSSTAFAVQTGTGVILLDDSSNRLVKRKLNSAAWKSNRSPEVTLQGKLAGDRFSATSIKAKP